MQKLVLVLPLILSFISCSPKKVTFNDYVASIKDYQHKMNMELKNKNESPLTEEDRKGFKSLDFFPIDSSYKVVAELKLDKNPKIFAMPTTTNESQLYITYGVAVFKLNGKKLTLHIYQSQDLIQQSEYKNHLFIPFQDKTNGYKTYAGGRFLDVEIPKNDTIVIDFNKAYNPYCAYNINYSCPIPPKENNLPIAINAGVKNYNHEY